MQRFDDGLSVAGSGSVNFSNRNGNLTTTTTTLASATMARPEGALTTPLTSIPSGANGSAPLQMFLVATTSAVGRHVEQQQQNQSLPMGAAAATAAAASVSVSATAPELTPIGAGTGTDLGTTPATATMTTTMLDTIMDLAAQNRRLELAHQDGGSGNLTFEPLPLVGPGEQSGGRAFADLIAANQSGAATLATNMFMMANSHQHHPLDYYHDQDHDHYQGQYNYHSQQDHNYHHNDYNHLTDNGNTLLLAGSDAANLATIVSNLSAWQLMLVVLLIGLILISIVGNCLVCIAIFTDRRLRKLGNAFIVSLAIADLFVSCLVMTFALCNDLMDYWMFGEWFCDVWISFDIMCCTASILNLCAISLDRFIHIKDCLLYNQLMTRRVAFSAVIVIWIISALVSFVPINLGWHKPSEYLNPAPEVNFLLANTSKIGNIDSDNFEQYLAASNIDNDSNGPINNYTPTHSQAGTGSRSKRSVPWGSQNHQLALELPFDNIDDDDNGNAQIDYFRGEGGLRRASLLRNVKRGLRDYQVGASDDGPHWRPELAQEWERRNHQQQQQRGHLKWTLSSSNDLKKEYEYVQQQQQQHRELSSVGGTGNSPAQKAPHRGRADHTRQDRQEQRRHSLFQANRDGRQQNGSNRAQRLSSWSSSQPLSSTRANSVTYRQAKAQDSISSLTGWSSSGGDGVGGQLNELVEKRASSSGSMKGAMPADTTQTPASLHNSRAPQAQVDVSSSQHRLVQTMGEEGRIFGDARQNHYYDYYHKLANGVGGAQEWADQVESNPQDGSRRERRQQIGQEQNGAKGGGRGGGGEDRDRLAGLRRQRPNSRQKRQAAEAAEVTKSSRQNRRVVGSDRDGRTKSHHNEPILSNHHQPGSQTQSGAGADHQRPVQVPAALRLQSSWSTAPNSEHGQREPPAREQQSDSVPPETRSPPNGAPNAKRLPQCMLTLTPTYAIISSTISFYIPCMIMLGLYSKLFACARRHVRNIRAITRAPNPIGGAPLPPPSPSLQTPTVASNRTTHSAAGYGASGLYNVLRLGNYRHQNKQQQQQQRQQSINRSPLEQSNCVASGTACPTHNSTTATAPNSSYNSSAHKPTGATNGSTSKCAGLKLHHRARTWIKFGKTTSRAKIGSGSAALGPRAQEAELMIGESAGQSDAATVDPTAAESVMNRGRPIGASTKAVSSTLRSPSASSSSSPTPPSSLYIPNIDGCSGVERTKTSASCSPRGAGGIDSQVIGNRNGKIESSCGEATDLASRDADASVSSAIEAQRLKDESINHHHRHCLADNSSHEDEPFLSRTTESVMNETDSNPCCNRADDSSQMPGAVCNNKQQLLPGAQVLSNRKATVEQARKQPFSAAALKLNLTPQQTQVSSHNGSRGRPQSVIAPMTNHEPNDHYYYQQQQQQQQNKQQTSQLATHKAAITLGIIMGTFLFCWVPFFCLNIIKAYFGDSIPSTMFRAFTWLGYANSALNPIIYGIHNTEFRNAFNRIFFKHLTLRNGRQYLNRRFSYDLRHHHSQHHHQQQQQQQQQPLDNNHHRHHHYQDQLQAVPLAQQQQQRQLKSLGIGVDHNNNNSDNIDNIDNIDSGGTAGGGVCSISLHMKYGVEPNKERTNSLLMADVAADIGSETSLSRQMSTATTTTQKSCLTLKRTSEDDTGLQQ